MTSKLHQKVDEIVQEFEITQEFLLKAVDLFIETANKHLAENDPSTETLPMVPTYVTHIPSGNEQGTLLACDLGGTNFRVVSVQLNGDHSFELTNEKSPIPQDLFKSTGDELFGWLAKKIGEFVDKHEEPNPKEKYKLGFTFSFPASQTSLNSGKLLHWTKGFNIPDVVGTDVCALLQKHLDSLNVPVRVAALSNDTTGVLLARSYTGYNKEGQTMIGCIFGTGSNGAYTEPLENIKKLSPEVRADLAAKGVTHMVVNTEWGSFDNELTLVPNTKWDKQVNENSPNKGGNMFEKRISGLYMGEILRCILMDLWEQKLLFTAYRKEKDLPHRLRTPFHLDTEAMSLFEIDDSTAMRASELKLQQMLHLPTTEEERVVIQKLTRAISHRSAYLSAVPIAAILVKIEAFRAHHVEIDVGADGSVVEFYPGFRTMMRDAIALTQLGPKGERRLHINIAKDGSSVGAALCALSSE